MTHVYAVHVLDSLLDYCQTELFAKYEDAQEAYDDYLVAHHDHIKHVHSQLDRGTPMSLGEDYPDEYDFIYYEGDESNVKILIEKIQIK